MWWTQVIVPLATAIVGSGAIGVFFRWLSQRPASKRQRDQAWEEFKNDTLERANHENDELRTRVALLEYRHFLRDELFMLFMEDVEELGADHAKMQRRREIWAKIRFEEDLDALKTIRVMDSR
ncbi:membrane protein [Gordonia phage Madi]|uniref:Membrane protein n=1 Tax=Gordonia phage Sienna TaxID=2759396 RepID=A0A7L7SLX4_9CAUD|nr:membrane protein [Gordonia phage Sienna]QYW00836.1 membrane protein [Gordonia phage Madi]